MTNLRVRVGGSWVDCTTIVAAHEGGGGLFFDTVQVDGTSTYYDQFDNPLPTDPAYFPIAVWGAYQMDDTTYADGQTGAQHVATDQAVGLNLYVYNDDVSEGANGNIAAEGMLSMPAVEMDQTYIGAHTRGWMIIDEPDMTLRSGSHTWNGTVGNWPDDCVGPGGIDSDEGARCGYTALDARSALAPDDRIKFVNWGKEVLFGDDGSSTEDADCGTFVNGWADLACSDLYWFTDPWQYEGTPAPYWFPETTGVTLTVAQLRRGANYGYQMDRMRELDGRDGTDPEDRKPIWIAIEVANPFTDSQGTIGEPAHRIILPAEQRSAVWHSLIAGARGILWFQHNFSDTIPSSGADHHALRNPTDFGPQVASVTAINEQIIELAPVLNSPTVVDAAFTDGVDVRSMVKLTATYIYVFSASTKAAAASSYSATFELTGLGDGIATVVDEARTVTITDDSWTDTFANGNVVHIYQIPRP